MEIKPIAYKKALEMCPEYKYNYLNIANVEYFRKNYKNLKNILQKYN